MVVCVPTEDHVQKIIIYGQMNQSSVFSMTHTFSTYKLLDRLPNDG